MDEKIIIVRKRTLRRQQRLEILADFKLDLEKVQLKLDNAITAREVLAYTRLYDILYAAYCEVIDSEV